MTWIEGFAVGVRAPTPALLAMAERACAWARAAVTPAADGDAGADWRRGVAADQAWIDSALVWAGTHFGPHAAPAVADPPWPWLGPVLAQHPPPPGPALILGGACGGAALQLPDACGSTTVVDAAPHALALGAALTERLRHGAPVALPMRREPWAIERLPLALPPAAARRLAQTSWPLADAADPLLAAGGFGVVACLGLLDSVADPWCVLQQAAALVAADGLLLIAAPWCDRPEITPPERSLTTLARRRGFASPSDALAAGALWRDDGGERRGALDEADWPRLRWRADSLPWVVRSHDRLQTHWRLDALLFQAPGGARGASPLR